MERLIKDNDIILDGTAPRFEKEHCAFVKLGIIEEMMETYHVKDLADLEYRLATHYSLVKLITDLAKVVSKGNGQNKDTQP